MRAQGFVMRTQLPQEGVRANQLATKGVSFAYKCCQKQSIYQTRWLSPPSGNLLKKKKGCISRMSKLLRQPPPSCWRFSSVGSLTVISSSSKPFWGKSRFLAKFTCRCCGWATLIQRLIPFCTPSATIVLSSSISHNTKA